jgi:polyribonucleotide nucleotidyltransferase
MKGPEGSIVVSATIDNGKYGTREIKFETGILALQANGSVTAYLDNETTILSTTTAGSEPKESYDFFPLTVDVEERMYAVGKIPGSFFRREGKASTEATLTARLIDRPLRPLFSKETRNEVQVVETILASNPNDFYDVVAINAASASTLISGLKFTGPVSGIRIVLIDDQWVAFPTAEQRDLATFEIVVAGRIAGDDVAIAMIEANAPEKTWDLVYKDGKTKPTEEVVSEGLEASKKFIKVLCEAQSELKSKVTKETVELPLFPEYTEDVYTAVEAEAKTDLETAYTVADKLARLEKVEAVKTRVHEKLDEQFGEEKIKDISNAFKSVSKKIVRTKILKEGFRIDGRKLDEIRPLYAEINVLPLVHGSALFMRGETQIMGVSTLNMLDMEQKLDTLGLETTKRYMHNYNFPPYSVGETGRVGAPKRREIGHGALAERALIPVLPTREEFPYAIRQVSEALGSNGSTSMGSVCASTMSLLAAGVPIKAPVAGIAMGLIGDVVDGEQTWATLTDILGEEDGFGDMDFKVAGTSEFVTAIQLDTKLDGIPASVLANALTQAKTARLAILDVLNGAISTPQELGATTPKIESVKIPGDKIGEVIGPKGKVIQELQERFGVSLSVEDEGDDGVVFVAGTDKAGIDAAKAEISEIVNPRKPQVGEVFDSVVANTAEFGAFVKLTPKYDGLLHISKLSPLADGRRVNKTEDVIREGDKVKVIVEAFDERKGRVSLAIVE